MTQPDTPLKRTPLHAAHVRLGARMIPFGGWDMPVQYAGIVEEHRTVRSAVGCFDVSHMGEFEFRGSDALRALQRLTTNDVSALEIGQVQYSLLCYEDGGIVDDLTLYRLTDDHYMMTVNASNIDKDWAWVSRHLDSRVEARNVSAETGVLSIRSVKEPSLAPGALERIQSNSKKWGPSVMGKKPVSARVPSSRRTRPSTL